MERPPDHFKKTLPVESEVVRKLIRSDRSRKAAFEDAMERCLEILAGASRPSVDGIASRVRSITPVELSEVRAAIAAEEHALSVSMNMSAAGDHITSSNMWPSPTCSTAGDLAGAAHLAWQPA